MAGLASILQKTEQQLGGIKLSAEAEFAGTLGQVVRAVWDEKSGRLVLVGEADARLPCIGLEELAVALLCGVGPMPFNPQFSLDPYVEKEPDGKWQKAVYIPEAELRGTSFGQIMYDADWLLKQYAFGVQLKYDDWLSKGTDPNDAGPMTEVWASSSRNGTGKWASCKVRRFSQEERKCLVPGFTNMADLRLQQRAVTDAPMRARQWIVSDRMVLMTNSGAFAFKTAKMAVKAKKQEKGRDGRLRDVAAEEPIANAFATNIMTTLYDRLAALEPPFSQVKELAKAIALAKWLKRLEIPTDIGWVGNMLAKRKDTVEVVTALRVQHERRRKTPFRDRDREGVRTEISSVYLFGGVDLTVTPTYMSDDGQAARLRKLVLEALAHTDAPIFTIKDGERVLQATVLPITGAGAAACKSRPIALKEGNGYRFDAQGKVLAATDTLGNVFNYGYNERGRLVSIDYKAATGASATARTLAAGYSLEINSGKGHRFQYLYDLAGVCKTVDVDGKPFITASYEAPTRRWELVYEDGEFAEDYRLDAQGVPVTYTRRKRGPSAPRTETLEIEESKRSSRLRSSAFGEVRLNYNLDGTLGTFKTSRSEWSYQYGPMQKLVTVTGPDGSGVVFQYADSSVRSCIYRLGGQEAKVELQGEAITSSTSPDGSLANYSYEGSGRLKNVSVDKESAACCQYDQDGRLRGITLPACDVGLGYGPDGSLRRFMCRTENQSTRRARPQRAEWISRLAADYRQLISAAEPSKAEEALKERLLGSEYRIIAVHSSFTPVRVFEVADSSGQVSILKVQNWNAEAERESRLNLELSDQLAQKGLAVTRALPVLGDERLVLSDGCIFTRETRALGQSMSDSRLVLSAEQLDSYVRFAFELFRQGKIPSDLAVKQAVTSEEAMRAKLLDRNERARRLYAGVKQVSSEVTLTAVERLDADSFHDRFEMLLKELFKGGSLRHSGLVHDNILRNYFIDGDTITTFDFGSDYRGNLGNVFSEVVRSVFWQKDQRYEYANFTACFDRTLSLYRKVAGENPSEADVREICRCMIMTPYIHSSFDWKALMNELKIELGIAVDSATDGRLWMEVVSPENQSRVRQKLQKHEEQYLRHMQQMRMTLRLLLDYTRSGAERATIRGFLETLDSVLKARILVVSVPAGEFMRVCVATSDPNGRIRCASPAAG